MSKIYMYGGASENSEKLEEYRRRQTKMKRSWKGNPSNTAEWCSKNRRRRIDFSLFVVTLILLLLFFCFFPLRRCFYTLTRQFPLFTSLYFNRHMFIHCSLYLVDDG